MEALIQKVKAFLEANRVQMGNGPILVAVSGGPDSIFLMQCLKVITREKGLSLLVGHIEHGMRPDDDPKETAFVEGQARLLGLKAITRKVAGDVLMGRGSREELLRLERHRILKDMAWESGAGLIALGHTMDDQAETFLMRLLRGSGGAGLGAMRVREGMLIRPLLCLRKDEIVSALKKEGIPFVMDPSNKDLRFTRNRIRHQLLPVLKGYNKRIVELLCHTCQSLALDEDYISKVALEWLTQNASIRRDQISFGVSEFSTLHQGLCAHILRTAYGLILGSFRGIQGVHIREAIRLGASKRPRGEVHFPGSLRFVKSHDLLILKKGPLPKAAIYLEVPGPGTYLIKEADLELVLEPLYGPAEPAAHGEDEALVDLNRISFPLLVRSVRPGDWFMPLGMVGRKKLQDFFVDLKIPREKRALVPVVLSGEDIVWVGGLRIDRRFRLQETTSAVLKMAIRKKGPFASQEDT